MIVSILGKGEGETLATSQTENQGLLVGDTRQTHPPVHARSTRHGGRRRTGPPAVAVATGAGPSTPQTSNPNATTAHGVTPAS